MLSAVIVVLSLLPMILAEWAFFATDNAHLKSLLYLCAFAIQPLATWLIIFNINLFT